MYYKVLATGSKGNAVIYHDTIMVDCGVPFSLVKPYLKSIQLVVLSHKHSDHINISTLKKMTSERPTLRVGCCEWMLPFLTGIKNVDVYEIGKEYNYGPFSIVPVQLFHDVPNCGYRILKPDYKIFHATDTAHLNGITAKGYDLYAIEHNYNEDTVYGIIEEKRLNGIFSHETGAINSHLSEQQARAFIFNNKGDNHKVVRLHE